MATFSSSWAVTSCAYSKTFGNRLQLQGRGQAVFAALRQPIGPLVERPQVAVYGRGNGRAHSRIGEECAGGLRPGRRGWDKKQLCRPHA
jgi:hypothetical protein